MISICGAKLGRIIKSRLRRKMLLAELIEVPNQFHGSRAAKRKAGKSSMPNGRIFRKTNTNTSIWHKGSRADQRIPSVDPLYARIKLRRAKFRIRSRWWVKDFI
jgi:hypothetical protein